MKQKHILLPPSADMIDGTVNSAVLLNAAAKDGTWKFLFEFSADIPLPDSGEDQDFDFSAWSDKDWQDVTVPGCLAMQGFNILNNTEYYYQRQVEIPSDYADRRVLIRFDGVYSNARVWIDGKYIRTHKGGFTTWDCDITDYVTVGEKVILTVGAADIFGDTKGIWNPSGERTDDPSGASFYANHNIGGITRDVTLISLPKDYISGIYVNTSFTDNTYTDTGLTITARLGMVSPSAKLKIELIDKYGRCAAEGYIEFENPYDESGLSEAEETIISVKAPLKWDAEHPNLYTLKATLTADGAVREVCSQRIGLREITYGGAKGTDSNKVYVNGKEIKLRGVCRHDVSYNTGRSTTREEDYAEILDYKKCNINFIRTSHYPVSRHLLDACDELGVYVEEENAACWGPVNCPPEQYLNGFKELVERDRNRACILIWSLANESKWDIPFQMEYDYIKSVDLTRLVIFSFPATSPITFDLCSVHYDNWNSTILGNSAAYYSGSNSTVLETRGLPVLHDEYVPSAVHHYYEIQRDLSARNFWGASIRWFWDNIFKTDGALGGAVWAAGDEVFYVPKQITKRLGAQGHSDGPTSGDGIWGNVHDSYKRMKPEAYLTKKGYSPVRIDEKDFNVSGNILTIPVSNWFDHTNLNELKLLYSVDGGETKVGVTPDIPPHGQGVIILNASLSGAKQINLRFYTTFGGCDMLIDEFGINLKEKVFRFESASGKMPVIDESADIITISGEDFSIVFDKKTARIQTARFKGETLITGGPDFYVTDIDLGKWIPAEDNAATVGADNDNNLAVITLMGTYENGQGVTFVVIVSGNGIVKTDYVLTTAPERTDNLKETGISYEIPSAIESVSWIRNAFYNVYPEDHIGRREGTALKVRKDSNVITDQYGIKPAWGWNQDMKDFSLYHNEDPRDGIVTNDFKTMRENIWIYDVNFTGTDSKIRVESEDASVAARVDVRAVWDLIDDRDQRIAYTGSWVHRDNHAGTLDAAGTDNYSYNKTESLTSDAGDFCELKFTGTGVCFISARQNDLGWLKVYIDGEFKEKILALAGWGTSKKRVIYSINSLHYGEHTIKIEAMEGTVAVDAFGVLIQNSTDQISRLIINQHWYYPNLSWGSYSGIPGKLSEGSTGSATILLTYTNIN